MFRIQITIFMLLAIFAGTVYSSEISYLEGSVSVNGKPAKSGMKIKMNDTVTTGAESAVRIVLFDGTVIGVKENTVFVFKDVNARHQKVNITLVKGMILSVVKKKSSFEINSSIASASVRGTIFFAEKREKGVYFCTCNGKVVYTSAKDTQTQDAIYHQGLLVNEDGTMLPGGMENHTDKEIFQLMTDLK